MPKRNFEQGIGLSASHSTSGRLLWCRSRR